MTYFTHLHSPSGENRKSHTEASPHKPHKRPPPLTRQSHHTSNINDDPSAYACVTAFVPFAYPSLRPIPLASVKTRILPSPIPTAIHRPATLARTRLIPVTAITQSSNLPIVAHLTHLQPQRTPRPPHARHGTSAGQTDDMPAYRSYKSAGTLPLPPHTGHRRGSKLP